MGTSRKTPEVLDAMVGHVRYEVGQIAEFVRFGNGWCDLLQPALGVFTRHSILEAGLIHFRCVIEFLDKEPESDQVMARDYVAGWTWKAKNELVRVKDMHGRVAHIGTVRQDTERDGGFNWSSWLVDEAPVVLAGYRDFLVALRDASSPRFEAFTVPLPGSPTVDIDRLDALLAGSQRAE